MGMTMSKRLATVGWKYVQICEVTNPAIIELVQFLSKHKVKKGVLIKIIESFGQADRGLPTPAHRYFPHIYYGS
jgi:hypothetical protein